MAAPLCCKVCRVLQLVRPVVFPEGDVKTLRVINSLLLSTGLVKDAEPQ